MNRIYSLVFNRALHQVQVVSEHANRRHGSTSRRAATRGAVPVISGLAVALALAVIPFGVSGQTLPGGYVIQDGIESITTPGSDTMVIDQGNHLRGLIDWVTFDIGEGYTVRFDQLPDAVALNVIGDVNPSQILGNLTADGTVFLINPNGIIFGDSASVTVGGLIASTLEVDGDDFLGGGDGIAMTSSGVPASITNSGTIVATGTQGITLLGGHLSNTGIITAVQGSINLLGTQTATLSFGTGNHLSIAVDEALTAVHSDPEVVHNDGELDADGGRVYMHANVASGVLSNAVNHTGIINASGIDDDGKGGVVLAGGGGGVVQGGSITSGGDALITAEGSVDLDGDSLDVAGLTVDAGSLDIASGLDLAGDLSITVADGGISQNGAWEVGGTSTLDAGSGAITLDNSGNDFVGLVHLGGGDVTIRDSSALTLGALDIGALDATSHGALHLGSGGIDGNLVARSNGGNITQGAGGLEVSGASVVDAGSGSIQLDQGGNRFAGEVQLTGGNAAITNELALDLGPLDVGSLAASSAGSVGLAGGDVGGELLVTSGGDITQTGAIVVGGASTLAAEGGSIGLTHADNDFAGVVSLDSEGAAEIASAGTLALGAVEVGSLDAVASNIELGGDIDTVGDQRYDGAVDLTADAALTSTAGDVLFEGSVDGAHALAVNAAGGAATFDGEIGGTAALGSLAVGADSVSFGNRVVVAGALSINADTGGIAQSAAWDVGGTSTLDAGTGAIDLSDAGNRFDGLVVLIGGAADIAASDVLRLGELNLAVLSARSGGDLDLGQGEVRGNLQATSTGGDIGQSGALEVDGTSNLSAVNGAIALGEANHFGGTVDLTAGGDVLINARDALALGTLAVGSLEVTSDGELDLGEGNIEGNLVAVSNDHAIRQTGALTVGGTSKVDAGSGAITLDQGNRFTGVVDLDGGAVVIRDMGALTLGNVGASSLEVVSGGALDLGIETIVTGSLDATSDAGGITQSGSLTVGGNAELNAGSGGITLRDSGNDFVGTVSLTGGDVSIVDSNTLRLGAVEASSLDATAATLQLGGSIETGGDQTYRGAVSLVGDRTLTSGAGDITFGSTVDGGGRVLEVSAFGTVAFQDDVGLGAALSGLDVTAGGFTSDGRIHLAGSLRLDIAEGGIAQSDSWRVTGDVDLAAHDGTIVLEASANSFRGTVSLAGGAVAIHGGGLLTLGTVDASTLDASAVTIQLSDNVDTIDYQAYDGRVRLLDSVALESAAGDITFGSVVDGAHALDVAAQAGTVTFTREVGAADRLTGLTVDAGQFTARSTLATSGDLSLTVGQGGIGQARRWDVGGTTTLHASGDITLDGANNAFAGTMDVTGGATTIVNSGALALGAVNVASLDVTSDGDLGLGLGGIDGDLVARSNGGDIGQSGALQVGGASDLDAAGGAIALTDEYNSFGGVVDLAGGAVSIRDSGALMLGTVDVASLQAVSGGALNLGAGTIGGHLDATSDAGGINQGGALEVAGDMDLAAGDGAIALVDIGNDFAGLVHLAGGATSIVDANALVLGTVDVSSLDATATTIQLGGDIATGGDQAYRGAVELMGDRTLASAAGDITFGSTVDGVHALDVAAGAGAATFTGAVGGTALLTGLTVNAAQFNAPSTLDTSGDLVLAAAQGGIDQADAWTVGGTTTLEAGGGGITLANAGNDFIGTVSLAGGAATIVDANALALGTVDVSSLDATATTIRLGGDIATSGDQTYRGAVALLDDRTLESGTGDISFGSTVDGAHALDVAAREGTVTFTGAVGETDPLTGLAVEAGQFNALSTLDTSGDLSLTVARGGIDQAGRWDVGGTATLDAAGNISLDNADNTFAGTVDLAGDAVTIVNSGALTLGGVDVASLDATSNGDLDLGHGNIDGDLVAYSNDGAISQSGALSVGGVGTLDAGAGDITLDDVDNDFVGLVHLAGGDTTIADANALALGNLVVASLEATSHGDLLLGQGSITGDLVARSNDGAIGQSGALSVGGAGTLDAGDGDITLDDADNDFAGPVHLAGAATSVVDANALALGDVDVASLEATSHGALGLGSGNIAGGLVARSNGGDIDQSGALAVGGTGTLDAGDGAIMLDDAGNDFAGLVHLAGGAVSVVDANALALGDLVVASLAVTSHGDLGLGSGAIAGDLVARSNGGAIGQSGALRVEGESSLGAGAGAITLEDEDNVFVGAVDVAGTGIAMFNATDLLVTSLDSGGAAVSLVADGDLTLPTHAIDTGAAGLRLAALGGALSAGGALSGGEVSLRGRDGIGMGGDVTALGTLTLESDGTVTRTGGVLNAQVLTGRVAGAATLGDGNAISELGAFSAGELELGTTGPLTVAGPVDAGSRLALRVDGDLAIHEQVSADTMRLDAEGAIGLEDDGRIVAGTLSGSAGGSTRLGSRDRFVDNQVDVLGDFASHAGFSMTNAGTLTLASIGGSEYSIDAGTAVTYLSIVDGHLLQEGTTPIRNGAGFYASTGHIGLADAPIHVIGVEQQTVEFVGLPPAYFYATRADGTLLPVVGANAVNVPVSVISSRVQRSSQGEVEYVDLGADASGYRAYGIVQPGIRLPDDQRPECDPDFPDPECIDA